MFKKVLIANRGEIAVRIARACREMGIRVVAVFSEADRDSLHLQYADEIYCIGPGPLGKSYLNDANIISAALISGVDAIHPGYGGLSEVPHFAEICNDHDITFIGPPVSALELMGDKAKAKETVAKAGVPTIPGSSGAISSLKDARNIADEMGYPVLIKAASGGGGKGIRVCRSESELERGISLSQSEAKSSFGDSAVYVEKVIPNPRHVEVQILADNHGNTIHLGERDCSLQRRHQKLLEESPSPVVDSKTRAELGNSAIKAIEAINYTNAGTVEFLLDEKGNFYFMEMNARIQVEHPVTEMVTGVDIVKEQLKIASGQKMNIKQGDISITGHAIECRICAEDPENNFAPSPGKLDLYLAPGGPGIRVDSHVYPDFVISPFYDSMFAKVISWAPNRQESIARMKRALDEMVITGIKTNIPFYKKLLDDESFIAGTVHTNYIQREFRFNK